MGTFYDNWLRFWDQTVERRRAARKVIHEEELAWLATPQDARVALLVAPETGFATWGTASLIAEIPVGWQTGEHAHGEEGIYIVAGEGFSIVNGVRYDWAKGSTLWMPFGARHRHVNTGPVPARYYSYLAIHLEHFVGLGKLEQFAECGPAPSGPDLPRSATGLDDRGRRIVLRWEDAPRRRGTEAGARSRRDGEEPLTGEAAMAVQGTSNHSSFIDFMGFVGRGRQEFQNMEIEITGILSDEPGLHGGKHAHMEATLYIIQGEGYSEVDGERIPWKAGSCVHIQGPQTVHQHFNTGTVPTYQLRCSPGIRTHFFQKIAQERFPYLWFETRSGSEVMLTDAGGRPHRHE